MIVVGLEVTLMIHDSFSLKEKRRVVKSIVDKMHNKYNVSAAEILDMDMLNRSVLGFVMVSNNHQYSEKVLQHIINEIDIYYEVEIIAADWIDY